MMKKKQWKSVSLSKRQLVGIRARFRTILLLAVYDRLKRLHEELRSLRLPCGEDLAKHSNLARDPYYDSISRESSSLSGAFRRSILYCLGGLDGCSVSRWVDLPASEATVWLDKVWNPFDKCWMCKLCFNEYFGTEEERELYELDYWREMAEEELIGRAIKSSQGEKTVIDMSKSLYHQYHLRYDSILANLDAYSSSELREMLAEINGIKFCLELFTEDSRLQPYQGDLLKIKEIIQLISKKVSD